MPFAQCYPLSILLWLLLQLVAVVPSEPAFVVVAVPLVAGPFAAVPLVVVPLVAVP